MGIIIFLLFISLSCLLYNVLTLDDGSKTGITQRLNYIKNRQQIICRKMNSVHHLKSGLLSQCWKGRQGCAQACSKR